MLKVQLNDVVKKLTNLEEWNAKLYGTWQIDRDAVQQANNDHCNFL